MCQNREEAIANCQRVYGHNEVAEPDYISRHVQKGHFYSIPEDMDWIIAPHQCSPGVLAVNDDAKPLCQL